LIGLLLFSVGVLGLVGLQSRMLQAQALTSMRADAQMLAQEGLALLWTDLPQVATYAGDACADRPRCADWQAKVGRVLPGGQAQVGWEADTRQVSVTVTWTLQGETHRWVTRSALLGAT